MGQKNACFCLLSAFDLDEGNATWAGFVCASQRFLSRMPFFHVEIKAASFFDEFAQGFRRERPDPAFGVDADAEQHLLHDIADAGEDVLVQQRVGRVSSGLASSFSGFAGPEVSFITSRLT